MHFTSSLLLTALAATTSLAAPTPASNDLLSKKDTSYGTYASYGSYDTPFCLTDDQAAAGADIFRLLIQEYSETLALDALTEDFVDWTSAVNIIRNRGNIGPFVVNAVSFASRAEFMAAQGSQPQIPFDTLGTWHGCDSITVRWQTLESAKGQPNEISPNIPAVGIALLKVVQDTANSYGFRLKELYSEFNSAAWLVNDGTLTPPPQSAAGPPAKREALPWVGII